MERWERWEKRQRGRQREREMTVPGSRSTITSENIAHKNGACDVCTHRYQQKTKVWVYMYVWAMG